MLSYLMITITIKIIILIYPKPDLIHPVTLFINKKGLKLQALRHLSQL